MHHRLLKHPSRVLRDFDKGVIDELGAHKDEITELRYGTNHCGVVSQVGGANIATHSRLGWNGLEPAQLPLPLPLRSR